MTTWRVITVSVLSCLASLLVGFAANGLLQRQALAQGSPAVAALNFDADDSTVSAALPSVGNSTIGPGGSFVSDVYRKVSPAVVHITNRFVTEGNFFMPPSEQESTGSGVIVDGKGFILTNSHVIEDAKQLFVVLSDGNQYSATVIGNDPGTDLALIKIDADGDLPVAPLGDSSKIDVGEWVVAIGNPLGFDWTVTAGVVSAIERDAPSPVGQTIRGLIQTDAAINPGNSGGPLLNAAGQVIGINERILSKSGGSEGIGLAIPINTAKSVLSDLIKYGKVQRAWLGARVLREVNPAIKARYNLPVDFGVIIQGVYSPSPASTAGLLPFSADRQSGVQYDILTAINGQKISSEIELLDYIRDRKEGENVQIEVYRVRNDKYSVQRLSTTLAQVPDAAQAWGII